MQNVKSIRKQLAEKLSNRDFTKNTVEIIGATFLADEESVFGTVDHSWNLREMNWYRSQSLSVYDIEEPIPQMWKNIADTNGFINSNYGFCIFSSENGNQYQNVLNKLRLDPDSRQGQLIFTKPSMHTDWNLNSRKDFLCTAYMQMFIRNNKLVSHYVMRSSDLIWGYKSDRNFASEIQKQMANDLKIECGDLIWTSSSAHVYSRHYFLIDNYLKTNSRETTISKTKYLELYPKSEYIL